MFTGIQKIKYKKLKTYKTMAEQTQPTYDNCEGDT